MRGSDEVKGTLFSYVNLEERVPSRRPLRKVGAVVNDARRSLDAQFDRLYAKEGRPLERTEMIDPDQPAANPLLDPV